MPNEQFVDRDIKCADCSNDFTFTAGEQKFYREREYSDPRRCKPCREDRKTKQRQE